MNRFRNLVTTLLGMAALAVLALIIVWLYKAQGTIPVSGAGAVASAPQATPTLPGPPEAAPPVVDTVAEATPLPAASSLPSQAESPLATPTAIPSVAPTATAGDAGGPLVIEGYGDFPRMAVIAHSGDQGGRAPYRLEGDSMTWLGDIRGYVPAESDYVSAASPRGQRIAIYLASSAIGQNVQVFDVQTGEAWVFDMAPTGSEALDSGRSWEITGIAWTDEEHLLLSRASWPSGDAYGEYWYEGTPYVVHGELWVTDVRGTEWKLLASGGDIYRVVGAAAGGGSVYVTRLIHELWEWKVEGFSVLDAASGELRLMWPPEEGDGLTYSQFTPVTLSGGVERIAFVSSRWEMTIHSEPPQVWLGDPETGTAELMWTAVESGESKLSRRRYVSPSQVMWSPDAAERLLVLCYDGIDRALWLVDIGKGTETKILDIAAPPMGYASGELLAWTEKGIVLRERETLSLLSPDGALLGQIAMADAEAVRASISDAYVNWPIPFVDQRYDMPGSFDGSWACGPTSMVMVLAYMGRLAGPPAASFGDYVAESYVHRHACGGVDYTFSATAPADTGPDGAGAYGQIMLQNEDDEWVAWAYTMYEYAEKHDVGHYYSAADQYSETNVKRLLDAGSPVVIGTTKLTRSGHIVVVKGYYEDNDTVFIINDPNYGERPATWDDMG